MQRFLLRLIIAVFAFLIGLAASSLWRVAWVNSEHVPSAPRYCDVHSTVLMYRAKSSAIYPEYRYDAEYPEAKKRLFPHSNSIEMLGCGNSPPIEQAGVETCPACRLAEKKWREERSKRLDE